MSIVKELKRRNVFRVAFAYVIIAWLTLQVGDTLAPALLLPDSVNSALAFFLILGFPLAIFLAWAFELTPEGLKKEKDVDRSESITRTTGRKLDYVMIAVLALALAYFTFDKFVLDPTRDAELVQSTTEAVSNQTVAAGTTVAAKKSIAVLPFVNMSNDPEQEYFSDGISEELLNVLAQFPGLQVAARTSAFQFKGRNQDIENIARQLGVNHILEGSVRKAGNKIRITAQLIEAQSGFHLWSDSYDRELDDIFAIQDEISAAIGAALKIELQLAPGEPPAPFPSVPATASAQAYEYYLKGRQLINGRSRQGTEDAVAALELALELDETFAPAHAQLAIAIGLLKAGGGTYGDLSMEEILVRAVPHVDRAFELKSDLAEAYGAKTLLATLNYRFTDSLEFSEKALALNPSYVDVINWRYLSLLSSGRWETAVKTMAHMMEVDPLSLVGRINYAYSLARSQRMEEARQVAEDLVAQSSGASYVTHALISGDYAGLLADSSKWYLKNLTIDPEDGFSRHRLGVNFASVGEFDEARRLAPDSHWWINAAQQRWDEAIAQARQRLEYNPRDNHASLGLANVLYLSGDLAAAREIYEQLLVIADGRAIYDSSNTTVLPTVRMARTRLAGGDAAGAHKLLELAKEDFRSRQRAGIHDSFMLRTAAMVAALEGDRQQVMANLEAAIDAGLRNQSIFREAAMKPYLEDPEFQALLSRLNSILAEERRKTLQLICFNNPAPKVWQPLPATCEGVVENRVILNSDQ